MNARRDMKWALVVSSLIGNGIDEVQCGTGGRLSVSHKRRIIIDHAVDPFTFLVVPSGVHSQSRSSCVHPIRRMVTARWRLIHDLSLLRLLLVDGRVVVSLVAPMGDDNRLVKVLVGIIAIPVSKGTQTAILRSA